MVAHRLPLAPRTRADCAQVPRPCRFHSCRYNLLGDVRRRGVPEPTESCVLDVVDAHPDGMTLEQLHEVLGYTRQRCDQLVRAALAKIAER